ncbi:hypothetical protein VaNZ11_002559 [Volvox africanus]|uniref:Uncharacterized protein n=1 Tax=Volvox africanus TaxID=51714 RepID=A0ABQ5RS40_9CHLO|nr:hypothetical protein VaNZ11_002559 [Volvox africanus]
MSQEPLKPLELLRKTKIYMLPKDIGQQLKNNMRSVGPEGQPALTLHRQLMAPGSIFHRRIQITFSTPMQSQAAGGRPLRTEAMVSGRFLPNARRITRLIERLHATASAATSRTRVRLDAEEDNGSSGCSLEASAALTRGLWLSAALGAANVGGCISWGGAIHAQPCSCLVVQTRFFKDAMATQQWRLQGDIQVGKRSRLIPHVTFTQGNLEERIGVVVGCRFEVMPTAEPKERDAQCDLMSEAMAAGAKGDIMLSLAALLHVPLAESYLLSFDWKDDKNVYSPETGVVR